MPPRKENGINRFSSTAMLVSLMALATTPASALAQRGGGGMGGSGGGRTTMPTMMPPPSTHGDADRAQDRTRDRDLTGDKDQDRLRDRDQTGDKDRDRDQDRDQTGDKDMDRDRDRLHTSQVVDDQLARFSLLSSAERDRFRSEMRSAKTAEERERVRAEHQNMIQERAKEMGIDAPGGAGTGPGAGAGNQSRSGYMLMTMLSEQERTRFMDRMKSATTAQERLQIQNEMHVMAQQRAREMGVDVPDWYGRGTGPAN